MVSKKRQRTTLAVVFTIVTSKITPLSMKTTIFETRITSSPTRKNSFVELTGNVPTSRSAT